MDSYTPVHQSGLPEYCTVSQVIQLHESSAVKTKLSIKAHALMHLLRFPLSMVLCWGLQNPGLDFRAGLSPAPYPEAVGPHQVLASPPPGPYTNPKVCVGPWEGPALELFVK